MQTTTMTAVGRGRRWRCLRESRLEVDVDLDRAQPVIVETDIDALTRAIERIAGSGGFALRLYSEAGPSADARLIVEDCAFELGAALAEALGPAAAGIAVEGAGDAGSQAGLPAALVTAFFESLGRALGVRIAVDAAAGPSRASGDVFAAAGRAIRAAARGREPVSRP